MPVFDRIRVLSRLNFEGPASNSNLGLLVVARFCSGIFRKFILPSQRFICYIDLTISTYITTHFLQCHFLRGAAILRYTKNRADIVFSEHSHCI